MHSAIAIGIVAGGALGFAWHKLVGCSSGACPLVRNRWLSILYGMLMGAIIAQAFR